MDLQEYDLRAVAKNNAEFITPINLRKFMANKVSGNNLTVLEPAIGSGQLLFELINRIKEIDGFDINEIALTYAKKNFGDKLNEMLKDFITTNIAKQYDCVISNYPFSLKPSNEQREFISNDKFLKTFFYKPNKEQTSLFEVEQNIKPDDIKGKLDFIFILKSFQYAQEGFYIAFPGIGYRKEEEKFRKYLIDNKFIKEIGILSNCKFEHTSISILFMHLTKIPNEVTKTFTLDFKTDEFIEGISRFEDNIFDFPEKIIEKVPFDAVDEELKARKCVIETIKKQLDFSELVYNLDIEIMQNLPSIKEFKQEIITMLNNRC